MKLVKGAPLFFYLLTLISVPLYADQNNSNSFTLDSIQNEYGSLINNVEYYLDKDAIKSLDELLDKGPVKFRQMDEEVILDKKHVYWVHFYLQNKTNKDLNLTLYLGDIDFFDFYHVVSQDSLEIVRGGGLMPAWKMTYPGAFRFAVPVRLEKDSTHQFYARLENGEFGQPYPVFKLYGEDRFEELTNLDWRNFWQGIFHGVLWVMIIYNIFFSFIGRDKTYFYYALYMFAISLYFLNIFGFLNKYVFYNHPEYGTYVWLIMQSAAIFYIIFVRKFLNLKVVHPLWDRISKYLLYAVIGFVVFKAGYFLIYKEYGILSYLSQIVLFLGALFTVGLIVSLIQTKSQLARYFTIGSLSLGIGLLFSSILAFSGEAYSKDFFYSIQIGIVFEIFFFSIGLSYKMSESEREKRIAQSDLIEQLKQNEKLQLSYQKELELEVKERTSELEDQKLILEKQKNKLEEINQEKSHIIGMVAHDLRNPLTSALSIAHLLHDDAVEKDQEQAEYAQVVVNSLERMNLMIEKILDIRAIDAQKLNLDPEKFDMASETESIINLFNDKARDKSIKIHKELNPVNVTLDKNYFFQIVENLVSNAIKFSPFGKNVFVRTYGLNGKACIEIKDEGPGFNSHDKKNIYRKFQQLSAKPTGGESTTGLGLSIVKKFVDAMDGILKLKSEERKGACFTIEFEKK
jgi:signal transduction histidine kinase